MNQAHPIDDLLHAIKTRCNRLLLLRIFLKGLTFGAGAVVLLSLFWILRGFEMPWGLPFAGAIVTLFVMLIVLAQRWMGRTRAAAFGDDHFGLKDGLATMLFLEEEKPGPEKKLQRRWVEEKAARCDPASIRPGFSKGWYGASLMTLVVAVALAFVPASPEVLAAREEARETKERVNEAKEQLEELIDEMEEELAAGELERDEAQMDEFRKLVEEIEETGDRTEAARQFARIEQKVREAARALDQRRDEGTLELAARELAKAQESEPRKIGKKLEGRDWKEAEEMLEKLAAKAVDPKDLKRNPKKLKEAQKELARMRAVTKRLAAAGKQRQASAAAAGKPGPENQAQDGANAKAGKAGKNGPIGKMAQNGQMGEIAEEGELLEDLMAELDEAAEEWQKKLREIELDPDAEFEEGECQRCAGRANDLMDKMRGKMRRMSGRQKAQSKLSRLRASLAKAQGMCRGEGSTSQSLTASKGGKKAGSGSAESKRQERDRSQDQGALAQLKGQQGSGPSMSAVEEAQSGSGVSGRQATAKNRDFARQVESFVQRDDVPEALKLGVRNYFENLQSGTPASEDDGETE